MLTLSAIFLWLSMQRDLNFLVHILPSLLSSSMEFRISPVLLAVEFSLEESSLTIRAFCFPWFIRCSASCSVSELTLGFVVFRFLGGSSSEDDERLLLLLLVAYLLFLFECLDFAVFAKRLTTGVKYCNEWLSWSNRLPKLAIFCCVLPRFHALSQHYCWSGLSDLHLGQTIFSQFGI